MQSLVHQNTYNSISSPNKNNDKSDNSSRSHSEEVIPPNMSDNITNKNDDLINRNSNIGRDSQNLKEEVINDDIAMVRKVIKLLSRKTKGILPKDEKRNLSNLKVNKVTLISTKRQRIIVTKSIMIKHRIQKKSVYTGR